MQTTSNHLYTGNDFDAEWKTYYGGDQVVVARCLHCENHYSADVHPDADGKVDHEAVLRTIIYELFAHADGCALLKAVNDAAEAKAEKRRYRKMMKQREYRARMRARGRLV